ncbi:uncharacterized protein BJ212DRAFT_1482711 [Suillus subaureus]|uniref:Uncharacterized protein n=1 Tax=Suillus subaureus TaxID=48587 RepID=A0A9P7JBE8_9AGAM|nr:uncharacterized protein BJ212DRAFT_1482711 [Suillus subaureus]KAG1813247.1 hypothetical protein BJ212DRAFT_1482711 [Suillus subaureus]
MSAPPRFLSSVHAEYCDDDPVKELNGTKDDVPVAQIMQLTGRAGNYNDYAPVVTCMDTTIRNQVIPVGTLFVQRDQILLLASQIEFQTTTITNNCIVWLRELLVAMVDEELITQAKFGETVEVNPLPGATIGVHSAHPSCS